MATVLLSVVIGVFFGRMLPKRPRASKVYEVSSADLNAVIRKDNKT